MGTTTRERFSAGELAPVIIPTCNRWQHFQNLVRSLQACPWAEKTHLYIALDAPFSEAVVEENRRILQISEQLTGFARVTIWQRESNLGAVQNITDAVDQVFQNHDRLILLEDDNIVAKNFFLFMNHVRTLKNNY
jgi:membrane glycosyltransferase